jgi:hypothetical protein
MSTAVQNCGALLDVSHDETKRFPRDRFDGLLRRFHAFLNDHDYHLNLGKIARDHLVDYIL